MKKRNNRLRQKFPNPFKWGIVILFSGLFLSCGKTLYQKNDFPFYDEAFKPEGSSVLRTDGVYVLDHIWTDENGGKTKPPKNHSFYKFYQTGQCNLTLDLSNNIKSKEDYLNAINKDFEVKKNTLFEGYYKLQNNKIVIQRAVVPRQQFEYKYGYIEKYSLILVKSTIEGNGKFDDKYFTKNYNEYYIFVPLDIKNEADPKW